MYTFNESEPRVGDEVQVRCDLLVEVARATPGAPYTWRFVEAGTRGRLIGWRDREEAPRAVVDITGTERRLVVFVHDRHVTRS